MRIALRRAVGRCVAAGHRALPALLVAVIAACDSGGAAGASAATSASAAPEARVGTTAVPTSAPNAGAHGAGPSATATANPAPSPGAPATAPTHVAAQHVLVVFKGAKNAPKTVTRSKADAKKRAEEAREKATTPGTDFAAVVAEYSEDAATKDRLGSVGKFERDAMTQPFADAAFALPVDGISAVVETDFGFHVIKRNQ